MREKTLNFIAVIILISVLGGAVYGLRLLGDAYSPKGDYVCKRWKHPISVQAISHSGTFGGGTDYIAKYDDGSYETGEMVDTDKDICADWEWVSSK